MEEGGDGRKGVTPRFLACTEVPSTERAKKKRKCAGGGVGETCNLGGDPLDLGCL